MSKEFFMSLFAGLLTITVFTACEKQNASTQNISESAYVPISVALKSYSENMSDMQSDKRDLQKLHDLMFDNYKNMTIFDFQSKVWKMIDTDEYRDYLEQLSKDEAFYQMKDSDEDVLYS